MSAARNNEQASWAEALNAIACFNSYGLSILTLVGLTSQEDS